MRTCLRQIYLFGDTEVAADPGYTYLGCYEDSTKERVLSGLVTSRDDMTKQVGGVPSLCFASMREDVRWDAVLLLHIFMGADTRYVDSETVSVITQYEAAHPKLFGPRHYLSLKNMALLMFELLDI